MSPYARMRIRTRRRVAWEASRTVLPRPPPVSPCAQAVADGNRRPLYFLELAPSIREEDFSRFVEEYRATVFNLTNAFHGVTITTTTLTEALQDQSET